MHRSDSYFWIRKFRNNDHSNFFFVELILISEITYLEISINSKLRYFSRMAGWQPGMISFRKTSIETHATVTIKIARWDCVFAKEQPCSYLVPTVFANIKGKMTIWSWFTHRNCKFRRKSLVWTQNYLPHSVLPRDMHFLGGGIEIKLTKLLGSNFSSCLLRAYAFYPVHCITMQMSTTFYALPRSCLSFPSRRYNFLAKCTPLEGLSFRVHKGTRCLAGSNTKKLDKYTTRRLCSAS